MIRELQVLMLTAVLLRASANLSDDMAPTTDVAWYADWKLWAGFASLVLSYVIRALVREKGHAIFFKILVRAGGNLLILFFMERHLLLTVMSIVMTSVACLLGRVIHAHCTGYFSCLRGTCPRAESDLEQEEFHLEVHSIYKDLSKPISLCLVRFAAQTMFVAFILLYLVQNQEVSSSTLFWASGLVVQLFAAKQMGNRWSERMDDWPVMLLASEYEGTPVVASHCLRLRMLLAMLSNDVYVYIILWSLPLVLRLSDTPRSFVMDAFSATFITTLDDLSTPKTVKVVIRGVEKAGTVLEQGKFQM